MKKVSPDLSESLQTIVKMIKGFEKIRRVLGTESVHSQGGREGQLPSRRTIFSSKMSFLGENEIFHLLLKTDF